MSNRQFDAASLVLLKAADLIEQKGWWDGKEATAAEKDSLCALQAMARCFITEDSFLAAEHRLKTRVGEHIVIWNDASDAKTVIAIQRFE